MYVVLAVALLAGVVVVGAQFLSDGGGADAAGTGGDAPATTADRSSSSTGAPSSTTASTTPSTTTSSSTTTSATTTTEASTTTATTSPPAPVAARQISSSFQGGWIAQLTSVPTSAGADAVDSAWSTATAYAADAVVTRSDDWTSLEPGYWVVVDTGPFGSADDVRAFCASIGHADQSDCLARQLSGRG